MSRKNVKPLHPLAMAAALENLNDRAGLLLAAISSIADLAPDMDAPQLRRGLARIVEAGGELRAALWPEED